MSDRPMTFAAWWDDHLDSFTTDREMARVAWTTAARQQDAEIARLRGLLASLNSWAEVFDFGDPEFTDIVDEVNALLAAEPLCRKCDSDPTITPGTCECAIHRDPGGAR